MKNKIRELEIEKECYNINHLLRSIGIAMCICCFIGIIIENNNKSDIIAFSMVMFAAIISLIISIYWFFTDKGKKIVKVRIRE